MKSKLTSKNIIIAEEIITGKPIKQAVREHKLCKQRISQITIARCKEYLFLHEVLNEKNKPKPLRELIKLVISRKNRI